MLPAEPPGPDRALVPEPEAPRFDPALPSTPEGIEAALTALLRTTLDPGASRGIYDIQDRISALDRQLFRIVFRREPRDSDPIPWDRAREQKGAFPVDPVQEQRDMALELVRSAIPPDKAYAIMMMWRCVTDQNAHLYTSDEIAAWHQAREDYRRQAEAGCPPLPPLVLFGAAHAANDSEDPFSTLRDWLGNDERAEVAARRLAALFDLLEAWPEFEDLRDEGGITYEAIRVAASANVIGTRFNVESFRQKLRSAH
jgi:hypothetical protein